jgi:hypothetical protein
MIIKKKFMKVIEIFVIFAATALFLPGVTIASVSPTSWDFGEVELGSSRAAIVRISAPDTQEVVLLTAFRLGLGSSSDFSVKTTIPESGIQLLPGHTVEIEIVYTPSAIGPTSDSLYIYTNPRGFEETVDLSGTGIAVAPLPSQSEIISVEDILAFFDNSVDSGYLEGDGKGKSAPNRLKALRNMIRSTGEIIKEGNNDIAFDKLLTILKKTDGQRSPDSPPDFVKGYGVGKLAGMIEGLMQQLE